MRFAGYDCPGSNQRRNRQPKAACKVIGAATGNITQRHRVTAQLQAGDYLVQRAVPAAGNHQIRSACVIPDKAGCIPALFRNIDRTQVSCAVKDGDNFRQEPPGLTGAGVGINNKVKGFHGRIHNSQFIIHNYLVYSYRMII